MRKFASSCGRSVLRIITSVLGAALVLFIWYKYPALVVSVFDVNILLVKMVCKLIPSPYGAMAESALRGGLGADKAMVFFEGQLAVDAVLLLLRLIFVKV